MNKVSLIILLAVFGFTTACKSKKQAVSTKGNVEILSAKMALKAIQEKPQPPSWVKIDAVVDLLQKGNSNSAVAEIRMRQDSILWVELSDRVIGIKAARAFAMADTVAFYNRIDQTYFAGSYSYVEKKLGTTLPFSYIFQVFQGQPFLVDGDIEVVNEHYILTQKTASGEAFLAEIEPKNLDCVHQEFVSATDVLKVFYSDYKFINGYRFPHKINVEVTGRQNLKANFVVTAIESNGPYKMPFTIGTSYERID